MTTSQTKVVQRGEPVTFVCEATGNPKPTIYWRHKNSDQLVGQGNKLTLDSVNPSQVGEYECVASVQGFEDAKMKNFLHLKGWFKIMFFKLFPAQCFYQCKVKYYEILFRTANN